MVVMSGQNSANVDGYEPMVSKNTESQKMLHSHRMHQKTVVRAGAVAIATNLVLTVLKIVVSGISGSLAVMSDALHGLVDALSGIVVIVSEKIKLSRLKKTLSHEEIEKIGARIIAVIIILVAVHILVEAVEGIWDPEQLSFSVPALVILMLGIGAKVALSYYLRRTARATRSDTLRASSVESLNDALISGAVALSLALQMMTGVNIEPYVSIAVAVIICWSGIQLLRGGSHHH